MKKIISLFTIMMMVVATPLFVSCGSDDDDNNDNIPEKQKTTRYVKSALGNDIFDYYDVTMTVKVDGKAVGDLKYDTPMEVGLKKVSAKIATLAVTGEGNEKIQIVSTLTRKANWKEVAKSKNNSLLFVFTNFVSPESTTDWSKITVTGVGMDDMDTIDNFEKFMELVEKDYAPELNYGK